MILAPILLKELSSSHHFLLFPKPPFLKLIKNLNEKEAIRPFQ
jgi:hypothetical protein